MNVNKISNRVSVFRKEFFCAAHRLHYDGWDEQTNYEVFGKCNNPGYHGHNYELEVKITGIPDPKTGFLVNLKTLSETIKSRVLKRFDHKNLNLDVDDFKHLNPTVENIAVVIHGLLRPEINPEHDLTIRVYETQKNYAEYPA
ncbi:MAG: 6-carboxytetrahydropterin synthase [Chitinophagaceae bacterium]|nr:6-carboxytetrahydropterin synthase [Chitinophagaceae bacterium]MCW5914392.1 6-carboxytetrahydropterin synthase [Chitinophagaceae bacterium]